MATDREYEKLKSQYNTALANIKTLEERQKRDVQQWKKYKQKNKILHDNVETLCQQILSKDRREIKLGKEKNWSSEDLGELVRRSTNTFNDILSNFQTKFRQTQRKSDERLRYIEETDLSVEHLETFLENMGITPDDIEKIKNSPSDLEEILEQAKEGFNNDKDLLGALSGNGPEVDPADNKKNPIQIFDEVSDHEKENDFDKFRAEQIDENQENMGVTAHKKMNKYAQKVQNAYKEKVAGIATTNLETVKTVAESFINRDWVVLQVMAEFGVSAQSDIIREVIAMGKRVGERYSSETVRNRFGKLQGQNIMIREETKGEKGKVIFWKLTAFGRGLYCYHFNKKEENITECLWDKLVRQHDNIEHGYGIFLLKEKIEKTEIFKSVQMFDIEPILLGDKKNGRKYEPDIVCIDNNDFPTYIEYEVGTTVQRAFTDKCVKMAAVTSTVNIVCPNTDAAYVNMNKIKQWLTSANREELKGIVIRLSTMASISVNKDLRKDENWRWVWYPHKSIEPQEHAT